MSTENIQTDHLGRPVLLVSKCVPNDLWKQTNTTELTTNRHLIKKRLWVMGKHLFLKNVIAENVVELIIKVLKTLTFSKRFRRGFIIVKSKSNI